MANERMLQPVSTTTTSTVATTPTPATILATAPSSLTTSSPPPILQTLLNQPFTVFSSPPHASLSGTPLPSSMSSMSFPGFTVFPPGLALSPAPAHHTTGQNPSSLSAAAVLASSSSEHHVNNTAVTGLHTINDASQKEKMHVTKACSNCKRAHLACGSERPCLRCVFAGRAESCADIEHKKRGRPRIDSFTQEPPVAETGPPKAKKMIKTEGDAPTPQDGPQTSVLAMAAIPTPLPAPKPVRDQKTLSVQSPPSVSGSVSLPALPTPLELFLPAAKAARLEGGQQQAKRLPTPVAPHHQQQSQPQQPLTFTPSQHYMMGSEQNLISRLFGLQSPPTPEKPLLPQPQPPTPSFILPTHFMPAPQLLLRLSSDLDPRQTYLTLNCVFVQASPHLKDLLGMEPSSLFNVSLFDLLAEYDLVKLSKFRREIVAAQGKVLKETFSFALPTGGRIRPLLMVAEMRLVTTKGDLPPLIMCVLSQVEGGLFALSSLAVANGTS